MALSHVSIRFCLFLCVFFLADRDIFSCFVFFVEKDSVETHDLSRILTLKRKVTHVLCTAFANIAS